MRPSRRIALAALRGRAHVANPFRDAALVGEFTSPAGKTIVVDGFFDGDDTWRLFSPYEFVWAGGRIGRALMQVYTWWFTARERFEARQAREREEEFRRAGERAALRAPEEDTEAAIGAAVLAASSWKL